MDKKILLIRKRVATIIFLMVGLLMLTMVSYSGEKVNFSGTWVFNESKSELGEQRRNDKQLAIKQEDNQLTIERLSTSRNGEDRASTEIIALDGKECINKVFQDRERKSTATWSEDGKTLTISSSMTFEREGQAMTSNSVENWTISESGNELIINFSSTSQRGERKGKRVYDKK